MENDYVVIITVLDDLTVLADLLQILSREFVYLRFYFELQFVQIFRYWVLGIASPLCMYGTALGPKVLAVRIHSGGTSDTRWHDELHTEFLECMAEANKGVADYLGFRTKKQMLC